MRIDHLAYRVKDRIKTIEFFQKTMGYKIDPELPNGFDIQFDNGSTASCYVLVPPERGTDLTWQITHIDGNVYHMAPEIFVSDGSDSSIVKDWVETHNGGLGGLHHVAYQVDSVKDKMDELEKTGLVEFTTKEPIECPGLVQVFTKPSPFTGIIYEFIERGKQGFCQDSVKDLMLSTKDL